MRLLHRPRGGNADERAGRKWYLARTKCRAPQPVLRGPAAFRAAFCGPRRTAARRRGLSRKF